MAVFKQEQVAWRVFIGGLLRNERRLGQKELIIMVIYYGVTDPDEKCRILFFRRFSDQKSDRPK